MHTQCLLPCWLAGFLAGGINHIKETAGQFGLIFQAASFHFVKMMKDILCFVKQSSSIEIDRMKYCAKKQDKTFIERCELTG